MSENSNTQIPLTAPFIEKDEILKVTEILKSGNLSTGHEVEQFERELAEYIGCKHVICLSSATAALHLAMIVAGIGPGDEVIMPAFGFPGAAEIPHLLGAKTVFCDVEYNTYNISPTSTEKAITPQTKAIVPISCFGWPYDLEAIRKIADQHSLKVIGDNAGAIGARYWDHKVGAAECDLYDKEGKNKTDKEGHVIRGKAEDMCIFSFHPTKTMTTGEGGCVCTENSDWAVQIRMLRNHGAIRREEPEPKMRFIVPGFNYRMSDLEAGLGRVQLEKLDEMISRRREAASLYHELLSALNPVKTMKSMKTATGNVPLPDKRWNIVTAYDREGYFHTFQRYVIYLTFHNAISVRQQLQKKGIGATFGYYCVPDEPFAERLGIYKRCPIARQCFMHTVALPLYHTITMDQQQQVVDTLKAILKL